MLSQIPKLPGLAGLFHEISGGVPKVKPSLFSRLAPHSHCVAEKRVVVIVFVASVLWSFAWISPLPSPPRPKKKTRVEILSGPPYRNPLRPGLLGGVQ